MTQSATTWYIVLQDGGFCDICRDQQLSTYGTGDEATEGEDTEGEDTEVAPTLECWGPFESQSIAIARRVGLIRAGKCKPR